MGKQANWHGSHEHKLLLEAETPHCAHHTGQHEPSEAVAQGSMNRCCL